LAAWVIPAVLLATTVATSVMSFQEQRRSTSAQRKANQIQNQGQDAELRRARVQEIARMRRERATALSFAESAGVMGEGGSVVGGINSAQSQSAGNQAFLTAQGDFRRAAGRQMDRASSASQRASAWNLGATTSQFGLDVYTNRANLFGPGG